MNTIDASTLKKMIDEGEAVFLIDVREQWEHEGKNIGGKLFPLGGIVNHINEIPTDIKVVLYCRKGIRSMIAIQKLQQKHCFDNLYNLTGGIESWPY